MKKKINIIGLFNLQTILCELSDTDLYIFFGSCLKI